MSFLNKLILKYSKSENPIKKNNYTIEEQKNNIDSA